MTQMGPNDARRVIWATGMSLLNFAFVVLYHFVQLVRVVTRDRLDEILDSSYWSYSRDIPSILSLRLMM